MTGREVLALAEATLYNSAPADKALAALDGCVVLTREEAALVREHVERDEQRMGGVPRCSCLALLTPEGAK